MNCNLPKELNERLKLLALLSRGMRKAGAAEPLTIGASAVDIHSNGAFPSADIEITVQDVALFQQELVRVGFHAGESSSAKLRYWNEDLGIGIRIFAHVQFLGKAPSARQVSFETGCGPIRVISLEDTIVALVAAFDANPRQQRKHLEQAARLYKTAGAVNRSYLDLRLREETLGRSLAWFVGLTAHRTAVARWGG
jgi:hypothetical protein